MGDNQSILPAPLRAMDRRAFITMVGGSLLDGLHE